MKEYFLNYSYDELIDTIENDWSMTESYFILSSQILHSVANIDWTDVVTHTGNLSNTQYITQPFVFGDKWDWLFIFWLDYINQNKIKLLYKDIVFESSYYGDLSTWLQKHSPMIDNYFYNIIDEKVSEAIEWLELNSESVLDIINTYNMPVSRDLMLTKAIEKYATEMATLLWAIKDPDINNWMKSIIDTFKQFTSKDKKFTSNPLSVNTKKDIPLVSKSKAVKSNKKTVNEQDEITEWVHWLL